VAFYQIARCNKKRVQPEVARVLFIPVERNMGSGIAKFSVWLILAQNRLDDG